MKNVVSCGKFLEDMKKLYTTPEYKRWNKRRSERQVRLLRKRKRKNSEYSDTYSNRLGRHLDMIDAPSDFRLLENTDECLSFFREIRDCRNFSALSNGVRHVKISLLSVQQIDYAAISVLSAIGDGLKLSRVNMQGNFPKDKRCRDMIIESGFLSQMYDDKNRRYSVKSKSSLIFFEKGMDRLSRKDNENLSKLINQVVRHLTGIDGNFASLKTILLEICGNSIEHAYSENRHWLLGIKYENEKVIFTVTDIGKGILDTLYRKFRIKLYDTFMFNSRLDILKGAFDKKYGSSTKEVNRNKGLPAVKSMMDDGAILDLVVLTNDVIWFCNNEQRSRNFDKGKARFRGTLYQWTITKDCITYNK